MTQQIQNQKNNLSNKNNINRKYWNKRTRGSAIPEADFQSSRFRTISYKGSETDHIERGLQNQYQRWGCHPEMLYDSPFHKKALKLPRRFQFSRLWIFRFFEIGPYSGTKQVLVDPNSRFGRSW